MGRELTNEEKKNGRIGCLVIVVILIIIQVACSTIFKGPESKIVNLNAAVAFDGTYLKVDNQDSFVWEKAKVTINDKYVYQTDFLAKGESSLMIREFTTSSGERFNPDTQKILQVIIYVPKAIDTNDGFWTGKFQ